MVQDCPSSSLAPRPKDRYEKVMSHERFLLLASCFLLQSWNRAEAGSCPGGYAALEGPSPSSRNFRTNQERKFPGDQVWAYFLKKSGAELPGMGFPPKFLPLDFYTEKGRRIDIYGTPFVLLRDGFVYNYKTRLPYIIDEAGTLVEVPFSLMTRATMLRFRGIGEQSELETLFRRTAEQFERLKDPTLARKGQAVLHGNPEKNSFFLRDALNERDARLLFRLLSAEPSAIAADLKGPNLLETWNRFNRLKAEILEYRTLLNKFPNDADATKLDRLESLVDSGWWTYAEKMKQAHLDADARKLLDTVMQFRGDIQQGKRLLFVGGPPDLEKTGVLSHATREVGSGRTAKKVNEQNLWILLYQKAHTGISNKFVSLSSDPTVSRRFAEMNHGYTYVVLAPEKSFDYNLVNEIWGIDSTEWEYLRSSQVTPQEIVGRFD